MEKYFCNTCLTSFYISHKEFKELLGWAKCPECKFFGRIQDVVYLGRVAQTLFKVTRTWFVKAYCAQEALDKTKHWDHDETSTSRINPENAFII